MAIISLAALCLGLNAPAADNQIDFSGKWILNNEKSDPSPRTTVIGRPADAGRGGAGANGNIGTVGGMAGGRAGGPMGGARAGGPVGGARAGGNMGGGGINGSPINPGIRVDRGTFDSESLIARDFPIVITQTGMEIKLVSTLRLNEKNLPYFEYYKLDGEEHEDTIPFGTDAETKRITRAKLNKNKLEVDITTYNPLGKEVQTHKEFSLSKDGKTLTLKVSSQSPNLLTSEKRVYERQRE